MQQTDKKYDADQQAAIDARDGYYLVLAPPGCGKTDILAERIAQARASGVEYDDMLCLTFTNRASRGMRARVMNRVGGEAASLFVGNVHRYCSKYIFDNHIVNEHTSILDEVDQADVLYDFNSDFFRKSNGQIDKNAVDNVVTLASYFTQRQKGHPEGVLFEVPRAEQLYRVACEADFKADAVPPEYQSVVCALQYLDYKRDNNIIDFDDILILAYDHLVANEHRRYRWIQVDEVQDLNPLQFAIIDQLVGHNPTVMYLGDEQQAIFSFMGAKLSMLDRLRRRCDGHILTLGNNYRAPDYLLNVCNDYAENELGVDPALLPKPVKHKEKDKWDLILTESAGQEAEHSRILDMVRFYLGKGDDERMAILVTRNADADKISDKLTENGITNFKISGQDMFKSKPYKTLSSFYSVLVNDFNFVCWTRLMLGVGAVNRPSEARTVMARLKDLMMTPTDLLSDETYLQRFYDRYVGGGEMVIFDTETTGLDVFADDIVQIAAYKIRNGQKVPGSEFDIVMHTDREIPPMLGAIPNPLVERYQQAHRLSREEGLRMFLDYVADSPLIGHNVTYDYLMLKNNAERTLGEMVEFNTFDSLHVVKCVMPNLRQYKLEYLVDTLRLEGRNSHLANEDIVATHSLLDYCVSRFEPVLAMQKQYLATVKVRNIKQRMRLLAPLFANIRSYLHTPIRITHHTIADELKYMYRLMVDNKIVYDLGPKFDIFLRYVQSEWVDTSGRDSLFDQIQRHTYDITSSINEGDLVNSDELMTDRVFIMTVYKGKGLEFDNVVVLGADATTYPFYLVTKTLKSSCSTPAERLKALIDRKEDARKFYVAISRAKKRLCISYSGYGVYGKRMGVTPFMESIAHHFTFFAKPPSA